MLSAYTYLILGLSLDLLADYYNLIPACLGRVFQLFQNGLSLEPSTPLGPTKFK